MYIFGLALFIIAFLFIICLLGYAAYTLFGQYGIIVYVFILCLTIIGIVMAIDYIY